MATEYAKLIIDGKELQLPVITGTEGEKAIDIRSLRQATGYITYDPGFGNTGSCKSAITFMDGEKGILRYRGIPIEQLAEQSTFVETAYLHHQRQTADTGRNLPGTASCSTTSPWSTKTCRFFIRISRGFPIPWAFCPPW